MQNNNRSRVIGEITRLGCTSNAKHVALSLISHLPQKYINETTAILGEDGTRNRSVILSYGGDDEGENSLDIEISDCGISMSKFHNGRYSSTFEHYDTIFRDKWGRPIPKNVSFLWEHLSAEFKSALKNFND